MPEEKAVKSGRLHMLKSPQISKENNAITAEETLSKHQTSIAIVFKKIKRRWNKENTTGKLMISLANKLIS